MREKQPNLVVDKSIDFALKTDDLDRMLVNEKKEYVLSKQILRSGMSIAANAREAVVALSRKEFIVKLNISPKEANATEYRLELLVHGKYIEINFRLLSDIGKLIRILASIKKKQLWDKRCNLNLFFILHPTY